MRFNSLLASLAATAFLTIAFIATASAGQDTAAPLAAAAAANMTMIAGVGRKGPSGLKTPGKRARKKCNGSTTSDCCTGISFCSCLYMPGSSSDNHPTSCHEGTPPSSG